MTRTLLICVVYMYTNSHINIAIRTPIEICRMHHELHDSILLRHAVRHNDTSPSQSSTNLYVSITTNKPDAKSIHIPNHNSEHSTKQSHAVHVAYPEKFIRDMLLHRLYEFQFSLSHLRCDGPSISSSTCEMTTQR